VKRTIEKAGKIGYLLKETFNAFLDDNVMKLSAALSYYTIFSLPPLLIIIINLAGIFFGEDAVRGKLFGQINGLVGNDSAMQIQDAIKNITLSGQGKLASTISISILIIGASGVFAEIQNSINFIWGVKAKPKKGILKFIKNRLMSFSMIGAVGFLLMVGLIVNSVMDVIGSKLTSFFSEDFIVVFYILNHLVVFIIITILFTIIFRKLPDGKIVLRDCIIGAAFTSLLFMAGRLAIGFYLGNSSIGTIYGAAGSIILILVWVYYSAIILYFGAEFTKVYAITHGKNIVPNDYTVKIHKENLEQ
jgi:membrane protein